MRRPLPERPPFPRDCLPAMRAPLYPQTPAQGYAISRKSLIGPLPLTHKKMFFSCAGHGLQKRPTLVGAAASSEQPREPGTGLMPLYYEFPSLAVDRPTAVVAAGGRNKQSLATRTRANRGTQFCFAYIYIRCQRWAPSWGVQESCPRGFCFNSFLLDIPQLYPLFFYPPLARVSYYAASIFVPYVPFFYYKSARTAYFLVFFDGTGLVLY